MRVASQLPLLNAEQAQLLQLFLVQEIFSPLIALYDSLEELSH